MKTNNLRLIQEDIKISRLIGVLEQLDISANSYYLENSTVTFSFMGITDNEQKQELYHRMVEQGEDLDKYFAPVKVNELAEEIYKQLMILG